MKRRYLSFLLILTMLFSMLVLPVSAEESEEEPVEQEETGSDAFSVRAKAALLINLDTGMDLYVLNPDEQNYPASLTKIMTCLLALENGNLTDMVTVSDTAFEGVDLVNGSSAGLMPGEELSLQNLLYCVMISSANEACNVVAEYVSGSVPDFVALMNARAKELGCTGTNFANTHGLHDENHYTTARDLSLIVREALKYEEFRTISNTAEYTVPATNLSKARTLFTTNDLISGKANNNFRYSKASGIKTGFTTPAGSCLISTASNGNLNLLSVIMGAPVEETEEGSGVWVRRNFPETINMFEYGFDNYQMATVLTTLYPVAEIQVNQSASAQTVALAPREEIRTLVSAGYVPEDLELDVKLKADSVDAPVEAGEVLGRVTVILEGKPLGTCDLVAITSISRSEITHQAEQAKNYVEDNWWKWLVGILVLLIVLILVCIILLEVHRRKERKRKVAARRRALELQRRKQEQDNSWLDFNSEE